MFIKTSWDISQHQFLSRLCKNSPAFLLQFCNALSSVFLHRNADTFLPAARCGVAQHKLIVGFIPLHSMQLLPLSSHTKSFATKPHNSHHYSFCHCRATLLKEPRQKLWLRATIRRQYRIVTHKSDLKKCQFTIIYIYFHYVTFPQLPLRTCLHRFAPRLKWHLWSCLFKSLIEIELHRSSIRISGVPWSPTPNDQVETKKIQKENIDSEKRYDVWVAQKAVLQIAVSKNATLATCSWSSNGYNNQRSPGADSNDSNEDLTKSNTSKSNQFWGNSAKTRNAIIAIRFDFRRTPPCYEGFRATLRSPERHWGGDAPRSRRSDGWARWNAYIDPWPHRGDFHNQINTCKKRCKKSTRDVSL